MTSGEGNLIEGNVTVSKAVIEGAPDEYKNVRSFKICYKGIVVLRTNDVIDILYPNDLVQVHIEKAKK